ncbi:MAG: NAD+ synthase [Thermodesulfovibrionia bacterium]|nr:NAD+ synthase [Thermodesulfovibrionia bacterium]
MNNMRISLAQINPTVGDLEGNRKKIVSYIKKAIAAKSDLIVFPELAVTGYPPEDLLLKPDFIDDSIDVLNEITRSVDGIAAIIGFVDKKEGIYNAAAVISNRKIIDVYHKKHLPNYGVFDEYRYFKKGIRYPVYNFAGINIGINICEDIWEKNGPAKVQSLSGAELIININASPYCMGKIAVREDTVKKRALECNAAMLYVNMVGGQDELVFDGGSFVMDAKGDMIVKGRQFVEEMLTFDLEPEMTMRQVSSNAGRKELKRLVFKGEKVEMIDIPSALSKRKPQLKNRRHKNISEAEEIYSALVLGTKDYVRKNRFKGAVIGMSGGVDSALVATIAVDALGRENVHGLFMPSIYTSKESRDDAYNHAKNLGIEIKTAPINDIFNVFLKTLSTEFSGTAPDTTEENLQARIRGTILMAFSNKFGWLVLTTGNKSEMSVGYATLYGDMAGGFAVIKDVPKTLVYKLCEWRNSKEGSLLIPENILWKEPTAELKPDQRDTDTLPPYPVLDPVLKAYVEDDRSFEEIMELGCDVNSVQKVIRMVDSSEYKRRQAPPGIKITQRAFGKDRRFPITNKYRSY